MLSARIGYVPLGAATIFNLIALTQAEFALPTIIVCAVAMAITVIACSFHFHRLQGPAALINPLFIVLLFSLASVYVKLGMFCLDENWFFPTWIEQNSPLFVASASEWGQSFLIHSVALSCVVCGYYAGARAAAIALAHRIPTDDPPLLINAPALLGLCVTFVALRTLATHVFGVGAFGSDNSTIGIPLVGGAINFGSWWGGVLSSATLLSYGLRNRRYDYAVGAALTGIVFALASMLATTSKSELLRVIMVIVCVVLVYARTIPQSTRRLVGGLGLMGAVLFAGLYPALHSQRYGGGMTEVVRNLSFEPLEGAAQILSRIHGIEGLVTVSAHFGMGGVPPPLTADYGAEYLRVCNVPELKVPLRLGIGLWGGSYLITGSYMGVLGASLLFGIALGFQWTWVCHSGGPIDLRIGMAAVFMLYTLNLMLFGGMLLLEVKSFVALLGCYYVVLMTCTAEPL